MKQVAHEHAPFLGLSLIFFIIGCILLWYLWYYRIPIRFYLGVSEMGYILLVIAYLVIGFLSLFAFIKTLQNQPLKRGIQITLSVIMILSILLSSAQIYVVQSNFGKGEINLNKLNTYYDSQEEWAARRTILIQGIKDGSQLSPFPSKTDLNACIHDELVFGDYSVASYYFESLPGFFVSGNLYRPYPHDSLVVGSHPGILLPHGHFTDGRFRNDSQYLGSTLARMGAFAITYDMVGRGESTQMGHKDSHSLTLQTWNSIRAIDFISSFPEVNQSQIAATGASGGGTQTFLVSALDDRIAVAAPVVMVASWMFGGCMCESGLPIHKGDGYATNNAEIAAISAPRPMLLVSDGTDWTRYTPDLEYPYIQRIYSFYDAEDQVENVHLPNDEHDYGFNKRVPVYYFFSQHLTLNLSKIVDFEGNVDESKTYICSIDSLKAFTETFPRPNYALIGQDSILAVLKSLQNNEENRN